MSAAQHEAMGRAAFGAYCRCPVYAARTPPLEVAPEDAARLFLPTVDEGPTPMQLVRPLPAARVAWLRGFAAAQAEKLAEEVE